MARIPKSGRRIMEVLEDSEYPLSELRERTGMSERTLRFAMNELKEKGMVVEGFDFRDMRRKTFRLAGRKI
ncbi:MAG: winged helix-turn-helix transcriptional regulator [Candidatus Aenigmarchaeota archaeon]|nr:winged helix-turn-helix transcriptional regulator [Candidatus Aenigmarchaeota archaeon]